jgi:hypothetical protein
MGRPSAWRESPPGNRSYTAGMEATVSGLFLIAAFAAVAVAVGFVAARLLRAARGDSEGSSDA